MYGGRQQYFVNTPSYLGVLGPIWKFSSLKIKYHGVSNRANFLGVWPVWSHQAADPG